MSTNTLALLVFTLALAACGTSGSGVGGASTTGSGGAGGSGGTGGTCAEGPATGDLPCDVGGVLSAKCQPCHTTPPQNGAKFPLRTYEDTQAPLGSRKRWQRMAEVVEPDGVPHMPYKDATQLTPAELDTLRAWFQSCAPPVAEGMGCDAM